MNATNNRYPRKPLTTDAKLAGSFPPPAQPGDWDYIEPPPTAVNDEARLKAEAQAHLKAVRFGTSLSPELEEALAKGDRNARAWRATETQEATPPRKRIEAKPFDPSKWQSIPPREWLYDDHYIRNFVTGTSAPSKQGKSTLVLAEAISMATGLDLLRVGPARMPSKRLKVWIWNGEDTEEELARRIKAICFYYGRARMNDATGEEPDQDRFDFDFEDLRGYLYLDSGRDTPIKIAAIESGGHSIKIAKPVVDDMVATIDGEGIDVTIIDPFINAHMIPERDERMDAVVGAFKDIAYRTETAIEHVHHTRKPLRGGGDVTSDDSRGSTAIVAAWRDSRVINVMNEDEAKEQGIVNRLRYIRVDSDRPNMTARGERVRWYYMESVSLDNRTADRPADDVGIVVPYDPPRKSEADKVSDALRIVGAVLKLLDDGKRVTKQTGGDYTIAELVPYLKRRADIKATKAEIKDALFGACEGPDAALEYVSDPKRGQAGFRRVKA